MDSSVEGVKSLIKTSRDVGYDQGVRDERKRLGRFLRDLAHESSLQGAVALQGAATLIENGRI